MVLCSKNYKHIVIKIHFTRTIILITNLWSSYNVETFYTKDLYMWTSN